MRFAYADPPYPGLAHLYKDQPEYSGEVSYADVIERLNREYADGWALSLHSPALREILPLCPPDVRVLAWVKPFASFKPGVGVAYAWEPVILRGGRRRQREKGTVRDWMPCNITLQQGLVGAKPEAFCYWLFEVLNVEPGDEFHDLYPGTGGVSRAWGKWRHRLPLLGRGALAAPDAGAGAHTRGEGR